MRALAPFSRLGSVLILATRVFSQDIGTPGTLSTNDIVCAQKNFEGLSEQPPPAVLVTTNGTSICGCANNINATGVVSSQICNSIAPPYGQVGYNDPGGRQNACMIQGGLATCTTACTPQAPSDGQGNCQVSAVASDGSTTALPSTAMQSVAQSVTQSSTQSSSTLLSTSGSTQASIASFTPSPPTAGTATSVSATLASPSLASTASTSEAHRYRRARGGLELAVFVFAAALATQ